MPLFDLATIDQIGLSLILGDFTFLFFFLYDHLVLISCFLRSLVQYCNLSCFAFSWVLLAPIIIFFKWLHETGCLRWSILVKMCKYNLLSLMRSVHGLSHFFVTGSKSCFKALQIFFHRGGNGFAIFYVFHLKVETFHANVYCAQLGQAFLLSNGQGYQHVMSVKPRVTMTNTKYRIIIITPIPWKTWNKGHSLTATITHMSHWWSVVFFCLKSIKYLCIPKAGFFTDFATTSAT